MTATRADGRTSAQATSRWQIMAAGSFASKSRQDRFPYAWNPNPRTRSARWPQVAPAQTSTASRHRARGHPSGSPTGGTGGAAPHPKGSRPGLGRQGNRNGRTTTAHVDGEVRSSRNIMWPAQNGDET